MNTTIPSKQIILIDNKNSTNRTDSIHYRNGYFYVQFKGNDKEYTYRDKNKCKILSLTKAIQPNDVFVKYKNRNITNILSINIYEDYYCIVICKNNHIVQGLISEFSFSTNVLANPNNRSIFSYFKDIATSISLHSEKENGEDINILKNQYDKISKVSDITVLSNYLSPNKSFNNPTLPNTIIYPFGINQSQKKAVEAALSNQISVIQGPPGTGKTQTILNIIANIVSSNKTVAMCACNNSATSNVAEKLEKQNLSFITAKLGSGDNKKKFIDNQSNPFINFNEWKLEDTEITDIQTKINNLNSELDIKFNLKNRVSKINEELINISTEQRHFLDYFNSLQINLPFTLTKTPSKKLLLLWNIVENFTESNKKLNLFRKIYYTIKYRKYGGLNLFTSNANEVIATIQNQYYISKIAELEAEKLNLYTQLDNYHFDEKLKVHKDLSMKLFQSFLSNKYSSTDFNDKFVLDDLFKNSDFFTNRYPVILSTTYSIKSSLNPNYIYDYLIIDEASQVDLATAILALSCAKNVVIVGDNKQLPNVISSLDIQKHESIIKNYPSLSKQYNFIEYNLLTSILETWPTIPQTLLREHYRCHPRIINFCNQKFYDNQLIIMTHDEGEPDVLQLVKTVEGNHQRNRSNQRQIDVIKQEVLPSLKEKDYKVGIITPFRNQVSELKEQLKDECELIDTVHKFQGREMDAIIISTVSNENSPFIDDLPMINVAVSRAIKSLTIVTSQNFCTGNSNYADLARYIEYNSGECNESNIHSVFDMLYSAYEKERNQYLKNTSKISTYDSENIMNQLLQDILNKYHYMNVSIARHLPLQSIIKDTTLLTPTEYAYAFHKFTHVDFLLYHKIDKRPLLAIEVDGATYHQKGTAQEERDLLKNQIFSKYNIPLLRLRTDGSNEEEIIITELKQAI